ncbi:hypothetical protein Esti_006638 [Eimeria stiedai]
MPQAQNSAAAAAARVAGAPAGAAAGGGAGGLPPAPPGCRWITEGPGGRLVELPPPQQQQQEGLGEASDSSSDADAAAAEEEGGPPKELLLHPQLLEGRRRWLLATCEAAGDTVCAMAIKQQQQQQQQQEQQQQQQELPPLLAVGASDDLCWLFDLTSVVPAAAAATAAARAAAAAASGEQQQLAAAVTLGEASDSVSCVAFSSDGLLLACGSFDGCVRVYSVAAAAAAAAAAGAAGAAGAAAGGALLQELKGPCEGIAALAFHPRGYGLLAASEDQTAWVWLLPSSWGTAAAAAAGAAAGLKPAVTLSVFAAPAPLTCCAFVSSGSRCLVGGASGALCLYTAKDGSSLVSLEAPPFDPQAKAVETLGPVPPPHTSSSSSGSMEVDGRDEGEARGCCLAGYENGYIVVVSEETLKVLLCVRAHAAAVETLLLVDPNHALAAAARGPQGASGALFLSGGLDGKVRLWDLSKKTVKLTLDCRYTPIHTPPSSNSNDSSSSSSSSSRDGEGVVRMLLHPELPLLLAASSYGLLRAFDCRSSSSRCCDLWTAHPAAIMDMQQISSSSNSSSGSRDWVIASGDADGGIAVWGLDPRLLLQGPLEALGAPKE